MAAAVVAPEERQEEHPLQSLAQSPPRPQESSLLPGTGLQSSR